MHPRLGEIHRMIRCSLALVPALLLASAGAAAPPMQEWPTYAADSGSTHYSRLTEIDRTNVGQLQLAWEWKPGEELKPDYGTRPGVFENTPLMIDNVLYLSTPYNRVVALDAETGTVRWTFDPKAYVDGQPPNGTGFVHRGVAAWRDGDKLRIFMNSRARLFCLDAKTGELVDSFGTHGVVDLTQGLRWSVDPKRYTNTSPPVIYKDLVILGNGVGDRLMYKNDPPGDVRAFDARSGKQVWNFHTIPMEGQPETATWANESWKVTGHANVWAPFTVDTTRGLVYLPVSTPSNDYYGVHRLGNNLFADSIVCLDAATGARKWYFQLAHHGLWDYDPPAAPVLVTMRVGGRQIDGVVQVTKQGFAFVFDRVTGDPVWPIEERPVPASDVPGEHASPTQPFPTRPRRNHAPGRDPGRRVRSDAGAEGAGTGADENVSDRSALHAAVAAGDIAAAWGHRRRELGWRRVRPGNGPALHQDEQRARRGAYPAVRSLAHQPARVRS